MPEGEGKKYANDFQIFIFNQKFLPSFRFLRLNSYTTSPIRFNDILNILCLQLAKSSPEASPILLTAYNAFTVVHSNKLRVITIPLLVYPAICPSFGNSWWFKISPNLFFFLCASVYTSMFHMTIISPLSCLVSIYFWPGPFQWNIDKEMTLNLIFLCLVVFTSFLLYSKFLQRPIKTLYNQI